MAGKEKMGMWFTTPGTMEEMGSQAKIWTVEMASDHAEVTVLDAGCGNATYTIPIANELTRYINKIHFYLADRQKDAILEARKIVHKYAQSKNINFEYIVSNMDELKFNEEIDGIICQFTLQLLAKDERIGALGKFMQYLKPNGLLYLSVPSIYDPKILDSESQFSRKFLSIENKIKNNPTKPLTKRMDFGKTMFFFTKSSLKILLELVGFVDIHISGMRNPKHSNRLSNRFPETYTVLARKPS